MDGTGNIFLPLVGSIEVRNLTIPECQQRIVDRLAGRILKQPFVTVRIAEARPISIIGDVRLPGSYPYRGGSLVKNAIAQAGGFWLGELTPGAALSELVIADERVRVLGATGRMLLIRQARLEAQRDGAKTFSPPVLPATLATRDDGEVANLIAQEKETLAEQSDAVEKQLALIRSQRPVLESEVRAVDGQISAQKEQLQLVQTQRQDYEKLMQTGSGKSYSLVQLQLSEFDKQSNIWRLNADLSRLHFSTLDLDMKIQGIEIGYKKQILSDLQDVRQRLREVQVTLSSAREIRELKLQQAGGSVGAPITREISIIRLRDTEVTTFQATETTLLEPGDIVEIRRLPSSSGKAPMASVDHNELEKPSKSQ